MSDYFQTFLIASLIGLCCGFLASIIYRILKRIIQKKKDKVNKPHDAIKPKYYITGDKHRDFRNLVRFCKKNRTTANDTIIILGDAGFNYYGDKRDEKLKKKLSKVNITLFCIHGNKENRPQNTRTYDTKEFCGSVVYFEERYPNILFAKDCEVYQFNGKSAIVVGGAHSVDKFYRIENRYPWWDDEEPSYEVKKLFEKILKRRKNKIDYIFSHTVPLKYEPAEMFISNHNKKSKKRKYVPNIDKSTEQWLDTIEGKITYSKWFCGHYHTDKLIDRLELMYKNIRELPENQEE